MSFYEQISKFYDYIFPAGKEQLEFLKNMISNRYERVLDIACGSGEYSIELAKSGHKVTAVDLDAEMVMQAKQKADKENLNITVLQCDMKEIEKRFITTLGFDFVFCIGNSIVHLGSPEDIQEALKQIYSIMNPGASVVLQIINFDRIIKYNISELPTLINSDIGLRFERKYEYNQNNGHIDFNTVLNVNNPTVNEHYENSIELFPLLGNDLLKMLEKAGFKNIQFYGDFQFSAYNEEAFLLVATAGKS